MENLFMQVLNMSLSAAVVIGVVLLVRLVLRSAPKKWRYLLWSAAGFRLCCPVSFKAFFSIFRLRPASVSVAADLGLIRALPQTLPSAVPIGVPAAMVTPFPVQLDPAAVPAAMTAAPQAPVPAPVQLWPTMGIVLWLCGMTVMLALGIIRYIRMKRLLSDAAALEPDVFATDRIRVPFILGLLPPRIYLPAGTEQAEQRFVLAHERVHIRRGDHWVKLLAYLLLAIHWFNPAVWAAFFLMSRDMEMSCDERVLRDLTGSAKAYSMTLLRFAEGRQFPAPAPLGFGESDAKSRIKNALRWKRPKLWITLTAIVLCIAAIAACTADPKEPKEPDASETAAGDTPWSWTSTLNAPDIREAALRSAATQTEILLSQDQINELTALLNAVPKDQVSGGRGTPSERVLELRDTGYALRFAGGVIELDCSRPRASTASAAPAWEIHDEALYAWLDALWTESPFGQGDDPLGLTMRAESVTPTGCTLMFTQSGGNITGELMTGEKFALFKRDAEGVWQDLFVGMKVGWLAIGYPIAAEGATEIDTYWGGAFTLEAGQYRIVKEVLDSRGTGDYDIYSIYAEFMIPAGETADPLGLTMGVEDLTPAGCTLVFTQSGGNVTGKLQTGAAYWLYRWDEDGNWKEVTVEEPLFWYDLAYGINQNGTSRLETSWEQPFGALEAGRYRIGKEVMDFRGGGDYDTYMIYAEFDLPAGAEERAHANPDADAEGWREAYRQLFRTVSENADYVDYLLGPVQAAGLLDLNGSGIPELILFFPGASKSHAAVVFTVEEGEVRAFNSVCTYGLPLSRYAVDEAFWANDLPAGQFADDVPAFRYYTENGEGFWLLNSGNAAWPAEVWCDWLRFGPAEDGCLTCQSLLSLSVEGEEDNRGTYTETGWRVNGEAVTAEAYHQTEEDFWSWKASLNALPSDPDAYVSCRDDPGDIPAQFDALLEHWKP